MGERTIVHTDGSCDNGGTKVGGWAWVNLDAGTHGWGRPQTPTTNQRMELAAVLEAICSHSDEPLTVVTDSRYAQQMYEAGWMARWERNGWDRKTSMTGREKPVENLDLVAAYHAVATAHPNLIVDWVRAMLVTKETKQQTNLPEKLRCPDRSGRHHPPLNVPRCRCSDPD